MIIFLLFILSIKADDCGQYSCNQKMCPCDLASLPNSIALQEDRLILQWDYVEQDIVFLIESDICSYMALAFNMTENNNFSVNELDVLNLIFINTFDNIRISDSFGVIENTVVDDSYKGGNESWTVLGFLHDNSTFKLKLKRLQLTGDPEDFQFKREDINIGYMIGNAPNSSLIYQNYNRGVKLVPLSLKVNKEDKWRDFVQIGHTVFLFIFWGIMADVGVFFSRYMRSYPKYAKVHGMIFLYSTIATYLYVFAIIQYNTTKIQEIYFYSTQIIIHFIFGLIIISLMTIQMFFGMIVKNNLESLNGSQKIYKIKLIHRMIGYFIYIITKIQVAIGMHIYAPELLIIFYGYYILLFFYKVANEILYYFQVSLLQRERVTYYYVEVDKNQIYETLLDKINLNSINYIYYQLAPRNQLVKEYPKLNYVILREAVYDVSDFNHPGGQYILERITGREIGRYFYGGYPIQNLHIKMHNHSQYAINYIETRYIGDFRNESCPILYQEDNSVVVNDKHIWKFEEYRAITQDAGLFIFQNHYFKVRQQLKGVQWFGKYFYIKPYSTGLQLYERPYSIVQCVSDVNIEWRQQIIEYFKQQIMDQDYSTIVPQKPQELTSEIGFIIKKHSFSLNMSRFIHGQAHKPYEVTGPYGLGLELDCLSDGIHLVFCQGTGILPFLDLIDYLLKKTIYNILYDQRGQNIANNVGDEDYRSNLGDNFQLVIHGAFKDIDNFYGFPIAQDLQFICNTFNVNIFEMNIRLNNKDNCGDNIKLVESKFTYQYLKKNIKYKPTKIYVCGSPQFEEDITDNLRDLGIPRKQIVIV